MLCVILFEYNTQPNMNIRRIAALIWGLIVIVTSSAIVMMPMASAAPAATQNTVTFTHQQQGIIKPYRIEYHDAPVIPNQ